MSAAVGRQRWRNWVLATAGLAAVRRTAFSERVAGLAGRAEERLQAAALAGNGHRGG